MQPIWGAEGKRGIQNWAYEIKIRRNRDKALCSKLRTPRRKHTKAGLLSGVGYHLLASDPSRGTSVRWRAGRSDSSGCGDRDGVWAVSKIVFGAQNWEHRGENTPKQGCCQGSGTTFWHQDRWEEFQPRWRVGRPNSNGCGDRDG